MLSIKPGKPGAGEGIKAVVGSLTDGTNDFCEMCGMQLYESGIDIIVQSTSVAFRNFYHSWIPVLMDHPHLHFGPIIIFIQTVGDPQDV